MRLGQNNLHHRRNRCSSNAPLVPTAHARRDPTSPTLAASTRQIGAALGPISGGQVTGGDGNPILTNSGAIVLVAQPEQRPAPRLPGPSVVKRLATPHERRPDEKLCWTQRPLGSSSSAEFHGIVQIR
jgi:hypothetical protein